MLFVLRGSSAAGGPGVSGPKKWAPRAHARYGSRLGAVVYLVAVSTVAVPHGAGRAHVSAPARRTGSDDSKGPGNSRASSRLSGLVASLGSRLERRGVDPAYLAALALAIAAASGPLLLIVSDFFTLFSARSVTAEIGSVSGGKNHLYAMLIIGLVAAPMAYGAVRGGSRPAMIALAALGILAAVVALVFDLPDATGASTLNKSFAYASAEATPEIGFYLETLGAALTVIAGGGALMLTVPEGAPASPAEPGRPNNPSPGERDEQARAEAAAARAQARAERGEEPPGPGP